MDIDGSLPIFSKQIKCSQFLDLQCNLSELNFIQASSLYNVGLVLYLWFNPLNLHYWQPSWINKVLNKS